MRAATTEEVALLTRAGYFKRFSYTAPRPGMPQDGGGSPEVWDKELGDGWLERIHFGHEGVTRWKQGPGAIGVNRPHSPPEPVLLDAL